MKWEPGNGRRRARLPDMVSGEEAYLLIKPGLG